MLFPNSIIKCAYSVHVEVGDVVAKVSHVFLAARLGSAAGVGRTHVSGDFANNVAQSHLVLNHLIVAILRGDGAQIQMSPGVRSELVAFSVHTLDDLGEFRGDINLALADVVTSNEKGSFGVVGSHDIKNVTSENLLRAVIVGESNGSWFGAAVDTVATKLDVSRLSTGNRGGAGAGWCHVLWASWAMLVVTAGREAVVAIISAVWNSLMKSFDM